MTSPHLDLGKAVSGISVESKIIGCCFRWHKRSNFYENFVV